MAGLEEFCCVCVKRHPRLENLKEEDENSVKYQQKLSVCVPDQKWEEEYNICRDCLDRLDSAYDFVQVCIRSEELRKEQLKILIEQRIKAEQFQCNSCGKQFKLKRSLKLHITRIHKFNKSNRENCEPAAVKIEDIKEAPILESPEGSDNSTFGDDQFDEFSGEDLKVSKKKLNRRKNPLTCEYCGKVFYRRQHYSAHIRAKHTFEKPYECDRCDAKYTNSHSLLVHKRNHNNEKPFICSYCGKSFVCSGDLYHHSKIHLNKREYKCALCDKSFNTASILRTHKICMHTDPTDWKYVCSYCSKRFPINSSLVTHLKRHTGVKEFTCHICDKQFFDKSELTKHFRCHSSERTFKCNMCQDKQYKNSYGLRKHLKLIHDVGSLKICKPEKKFLCPMCPKIFTFNNKLQKHIYTHTGEKPFKCEMCDKKFIDNYYRKVHLKKKHNVQMVDESLQI